MKKLIVFVVLFCIVSVFSLNVHALTTTQTLDSSTNPEWFIPDDYDPYPGDMDYGRSLPRGGGINPYYRDYSEDWGWTHSVTFNISGPITIIGGYSYYRSLGC